MTTSSTPLWLEIKTEYIDANLDSVITYLAKESANSAHDAFYDETVSLLGRRIEELCRTLSEEVIWEADESADKDALSAALRMLGAAILVDSPCASYFFFVKTLIGLVPSSYAEDLAQIAVTSLADRLIKPGFGWNDIRDLQPEVLAHKLVADVRFSGDSLPEIWFQGHGSICIRNGFIELHASNRDTAALTRTVSSLPLLDERIMVQSAPGERIQQKDEDNLDVMDAFTTNFLREASQTRPAPVRRLKTYSVGDVLPVRFLGVDPSGDLMVETVEGDHEPITGTVPARGTSSLFYKTPDFAKHFRCGDVFDAKLLSENKKTFSLDAWFIQSVGEHVVRTGENLLARLHEIKKGKMTWWTEDGYPAYSFMEDKPDGTPYVPGEFAIVFITACKANGYVDASVIEPSDETFDEEDSKDYCIGECVYPEDAVFPVAPVLNVLDPCLAKGLVRLLYAWQRTVGQASERFRILCVCRILSQMTGDSTGEEYAQLSCAYLKNLVAFATGDMARVKALRPSALLSEVGPVVLRSDITRLLQAYGVDADADYLSGIIHDGTAHPVLVRLAKLIQSCNRIDDVYPAIKTVIKREITKFLAVETEDNTDFEEAVGPNLGVENSRQEFKTSFFFAPADAHERNQEKTIFRSLCSFLNTQDGGTLYLGVNDSGGINGLANDLEHLQKKVAGRYSGIDGYIRYITDRAKAWFDLDVRIHFKMESIYDGRVVAISVEPYRHGVVEFDGIPYIRNNSESVRMSQALRRQIETRRHLAGREQPKNVVALAEAIREERQVTVFGYASSNSGDIRDRHVEPFAFVGNYTYVWAYDLEDGKCKLFRLSRIGNVKVTGTWEHKADHRKNPVDIFHFQGAESMPVRLELDLLAKNLLTEEYPDAGADLTDLGEGRWLLETTVHQIHGIARFYTGLAEHIHILDAPELENYARDYFRRALENLG